MVGLLEGARFTVAPFKLRKESQIKTIQSSLAIEGNILTIDQMTALIEGKRVLGRQKDILEAQNAIEVYKDLQRWNGFSIESMLQAHKLLMNGLLFECGHFRDVGVGVFKAGELIHRALSADLIPQLMENLFSFIAEEKDIDLIAKACIFHYEFEKIHPFRDGNGRIGRLWQQLILMRENPVFEYIPVEVMIRNSQQEYYSVLSQCDKIGECTLFIEYSFKQIVSALNEYIEDLELGGRINWNERLRYAKFKIGSKIFQRKDYIKLLKNISTSTASRDLEYGVENNILQKMGSVNLTEYKFI